MGLNLSMRVTIEKILVLMQRQDSRKRVKSSISSTNLRSPLKPISSTVALPSDFMKCLVTREKAIHKQRIVHLQNEHDRPIQMVLAAVKNKKGKTPNYHIFDMTSGKESSFTKRSSTLEITCVFFFILFYT